MEKERPDEWNISSVSDVSGGTRGKYRSANSCPCHGDYARLAQRFMGSGKRASRAGSVDPGLRPGACGIGSAGHATHHHRHIAAYLWLAMAAKSDIAGSGSESQTRRGSDFSSG